jgi:hypothetical protein
VVIYNRRFGATCRFHNQGPRIQNSWPLGRFSCPETSVRNYHYSLLNNPEQRKSLVLRGRSLKSQIPWVCMFSVRSERYEARNRTVILLYQPVFWHLYKYHLCQSCMQTYSLTVTYFISGRDDAFRPYVLLCWLKYIQIWFCNIKRDSFTIIHIFLNSF